MWLMTKYGFFSIVSAWKTETDKTPHPDLVMIRSRRREHLGNLQNRFEILKDCVITETPHTDYPYRIITGKAEIAPVISELLAEVDYCNFKSEVHKSLTDDAAYQAFLMNVWSDGVRMQHG